MSSELTLPALPAHLAHLSQNASLASVSNAIMANAASASFHRISIKSSRWRLNDPQGQETVVPTLHLDVIIVGSNLHKSKTWYEKQYNPADTEFKAPDCWSDNGVAPSTQAAKPQCVSCAACPHNVWGSKITPSGAQTKACGDSLKLGVLLADNPTGPVYQLRVPAASLANIGNYIKLLNDKGVPAPAMVTRLTFDSQSDYPKILCQPVSYASVEQGHAVGEVLGADEVNQVTGAGDKPITALPAAGQPAVQPVQNTVTLATPAPLTLTPTPNTGVDTVTLPGWLGNGAVAAPVAAEPAKRTRTRKTAEAQLDLLPATPAAAAGNGAAQPAPLPAAAAVRTSAPATSSSLDDLIAQALKV